MKDFKKFITTMEEDFNQAVAGIEKEIKTIRKTLSEDYYNDNIETYTIIQALDNSLENFKNYLIEFNRICTTSSFYTLSLENENSDGMSDIEVYAQLFVMDAIYKNNAYGDIYEKYEEYAKRVKDFLLRYVHHPCSS